MQDPALLFEVKTLQEDDGSWTAVMPNIDCAEAVGVTEAEAREKALELGHRLHAAALAELRKTMVPLFNVEPPDDVGTIEVAETLAADCLKLQRANAAAMETGALFAWLYERTEWATAICVGAALELESLLDDPDNYPREDDVHDAARVVIAASKAAADFVGEGEATMRRFLHGRVYAAGPDRQPKKPDTTETAKALEAVAADAVGGG